MTHKEDFTVQASSKENLKLVIQTLIMLSLGWVGTTLNQLQKDTVVVQAQLVDIKVTVSNIPQMQSDIAVNKSDISRLKQDVDEIRTLKGAK